MPLHRVKTTQGEQGKNTLNKYMYIGHVCYCYAASEAKVARQKDMMK